jgi:hypothetical protein
MAYVCFQTGVADALARQPQPARSTAPASIPCLTALEWSVVALARGDDLSSLRMPGRLAVAMGGLFGTRHNPRLADPRLEALRRVAVLIQHQGVALPEQELAAFVDAGFEPAQYRLVANSLGVRRTDTSGGM